MNTRFLLPMLAFVGLLVLLFVGLYGNPTRLPSPLIDKPAPAFVLPKLKQAEATLSSADFAGQVVLLNVWATWCVACRQEHDFLLQLAKSGDVPIYGLNWRDQRDAALRWLDQLGDPYTASAFDADGRVGIDWGVYGAPETFLIDAQGMVLFKHVSPLNEQVWAAEFAPRIAAARQSAL